MVDPSAARFFVGCPSYQQSGRRLAMSRSKLAAALITIAIPIPYCLAQQTAVPGNDARVEWLRQHAIALRSIDPADDDFSDLEPLRKAIGEARIVQLGETSHGDGATFHAKGRLIKFLHQKMGFDVLAMESGLYDCRKAWDLLRAGKEPYEAVAHGVSSTWTGSEQFQPVIDYLGKTVKTDRPLELCGFDCQFTARASQVFLLNDVRAILSKLDRELIDAATGAALLDELDAMLKHQKPTDEADYEKRRSTVAKFVQALATVPASDRFPETELYFWRQYAVSLAAYAEAMWKPFLESVFERDKQMAQNLVWLARKAYPQRKIIVWAASYHLQRNPASVQLLAYTNEVGQPAVPPAANRDRVTMGNEVWKVLGKETYTLAFTAADGEAGRGARFHQKLSEVKRGSLEDLFVTAGHTNAILDFRHLDASGAWLRERLASWPMGYEESAADWTNVFDGIVFTHTMYPSTLAKRATSAERFAFTSPSRPPSSPTSPPSNPARPPEVAREQFAEGWSGPKKGAGDYEAGLDTQVKHGGKSSAYLKTTAEQPSPFFSLLVQNFAADEYRGKRLRMTAFVKSQDVEDRAGLVMQVDGKEMTMLALDTMSARPIKGSNDWNEYQIVLDVPDEAAEIVFGLRCFGKGQVWVDDFKFETVGQDVATTGMSARSQKRQRELATDLSQGPRNLGFEE
jgi:erythromycin esterase